MRKSFSPLKGLGQYLRFLFITGIGRADVGVNFDSATRTIGAWKIE